MSQRNIHSLIKRQPKIVFLFSDTGGGHRSAAEAIIEALELEFPSQTRHEMVDFFREYAPPPLAHTPDFYLPLSKNPGLLGLMFHISDGPARTRIFMKMMRPYFKLGVKRLLNDHPADLFVSVHPLINAPLGLELEIKGANTPFVAVVTDLVTTHATWYWNRSNLIIVPTEAAFHRGVRNGFPPERLRIIGLPVAERYRQMSVDTFEGYSKKIRSRLGLPSDRPVVLLVGGGEGMGPLERIAKTIDSANLPVTLVIVAGRNKKLKEKLDHYPWKTPTFIYGFVQNMPDFMRAADMLVSKAGPGTISEAFVAGLPIILYSRLVGSEEGNVDLVVQNNAGVWAPKPCLVVEAVKFWLDNPEKRLLTSKACLSLARPNTAREIAHILMDKIKEQTDLYDN